MRSVKTWLKLNLSLNLKLNLKNWRIDIGFISDETNTKLSAQTNWSWSSVCVNKSVKFPDWRRQIFRNRFRSLECCSCSCIFSPLRKWKVERWEYEDDDDGDGKTMSPLRQIQNPLMNEWSRPAWMNVIGSVIIGGVCQKWRAVISFFRVYWRGEGWPDDSFFK